MLSLEYFLKDSCKIYYNKSFQIFKGITGGVSEENGLWEIPGGYLQISEKNIKLFLRKSMQSFLGKSLEKFP